MNRIISKQQISIHKICNIHKVKFKQNKDDYKQNSSNKSASNMFSFALNVPKDTPSEDLSATIKLCLLSACDNVFVLFRMHSKDKKWLKSQKPN